MHQVPHPFTLSLPPSLSLHPHPLISLPSLLSFLACRPSLKVSRRFKQHSRNNLNIITCFNSEMEETNRDFSRYFCRL